MSYPQRIEDVEEREDPRFQYEMVDGVLYAYAGLAEDPSIPPPCEEVDGEWYPYAERGAPVVQGDLHGKTLERLVNMTTGLLLEWPKVGIFFDVFLYWKKGQKDPVAPDLYVFPRVRQLKRRRRHSVYLWREPSHPVFVLEILSGSNTEEVMEEKFLIYQDELRIPEYFQCDPRPHPPTMSGLRLRDGVYVPISPDERGRIWSEQIKGWFGVNEAGQVHVWSESDERMPGYKEALEERKQALRERDAALREKEAALREKEAALREKEMAQREKDAVRREKEMAQREKDAAQREKDAARREKEIAEREKDEALARLQAAEERLRELEQQLKRQ